MSLASIALLQPRPWPSHPTQVRRKSPILYTADPIDRFRMWCVVRPSVSLSQRLEEYLSWSPSIGAALAPHRPLAIPYRYAPVSFRVPLALSGTFISPLSWPRMRSRKCCFYGDSIVVSGLPVTPTKESFPLG